MFSPIIHVRKAPGLPSAGLIVGEGFRFACSLGRSGIGRQKREGDGGTPAGTLTPYALLYRADRLHRPATGLPAEALSPDDGWCDDPADRNYNRPVKLPYPSRHERLWREDHLYDAIVLLDWNSAPVQRGRGSAVFLHLRRSNGGPTDGCIAVSSADMRRLLAQLTPETEFRVG